MVDAMIDKVKAAFAPGADAATKQQAATILRGLLSMLESGVQPTAIVPGVAPASSGPPDVLTAIVESLRPFLPPEAAANLPRFRVPMIKMGG
jgi:hypothetical protein